ncbi:MAG: DUF429 domain-containing protein [Desulfurococcus sp.]|nr:DUF429 domain-containing protein [Desulfurococcus sp.]
MVRYAGVDLAGSPLNPSGLVILEQLATPRVAYAGLLYGDEDLLYYIEKFKPYIIAIDAPLTPPHGSSYRRVDLKLLREGYRLLPPGWRGMRALTKRGMRLAEKLRGVGIRVVETHPGSALKSSRCSSLSELLSTMGLTVDIDLSKDLADALIASIVALKLKESCVEVYRDSDGEIVLLKPLCMQHY